MLHLIRFSWIWFVEQRFIATVDSKIKIVKETFSISGSGGRRLFVLQAVVTIWITCKQMKCYLDLYSERIILASFWWPNPSFKLKLYRCKLLFQLNSRIHGLLTLYPWLIPLILHASGGAQANIIDVELTAWITTFFGGSLGTAKRNKPRDANVWKIKTLFSTKETKIWVFHTQDQYFHLWHNIFTYTVLYYIFSFHPLSTVANASPKIPSIIQS